MTTSAVLDDGDTAESGKADEDEAHEEEVSMHQQSPEWDDGGTGEVAATTRVLTEENHPAIYACVPDGASSHIAEVRRVSTNESGVRSHDGGFSTPRPANDTIPLPLAREPSVAFSAEVVDADEEDRMVDELVQRALREERERTALAEVIPDEDLDSVMGDTPVEPTSDECWARFNPGIRLLLVLLVTLGAAGTAIWAAITFSGGVSPPSDLTVSMQPTAMPSSLPTREPSASPSTNPSISPSNYPKFEPTFDGATTKSKPEGKTGDTVIIAISIGCFVVIALLLAFDFWQQRLHNAAGFS